MAQIYLELERPKIALALGVVTTAIVFLLAHGGVIGLIKRFTSRRAGYESINNLYVDSDGKATEESQRQYSTLFPRTLGLLSTHLGLGVAIASIVLEARHGSTMVIVDGALRAACWGLLGVQGLHVFLEKQPTVRFRGGVLAMFSALFILVELGLVCALCVRWQPPTDSATKLLIALPATQAGLAVVAILSFVTLRRRPDVFTKEGKPVDREFTVSLLARLTFMWALPLLAYARKHKTLTLEEIPRLADYARADTLQHTYNENRKEGRRLWLQLVIFLRGAFTKQMLLISVVSVTQFLPQLAMFNLLNLLEQRSPHGDVSPMAWAWVVGLFASMLVSSWIEAFLFWIVMGQIAIPCRNLLSTLVFLKSTRKKDVKGVQATKKAVEKAGDVEGAVVNLANGKTDQEDTAVGADKKEEEKKEEEEDDGVNKSRSAVVNLIGVDTNRVADFCSYVYIFPGSVVKLVVSFAFLWRLVGGIPLLCGVAAFFLALPLNIWFSKNYNELQGALMKMRDLKMAIVTEALQGIRQIKFSALERAWEKKIIERRENELKTLWSTFKWDTALIGIWIFGPIMLAAALLTSYALIHGELGPSIAFTAIAILGSIEMTLAVIPELTTDAIDAWVSLRRIEDYLNAPDKSDCVTASEKIALSEASVAWPADSQEQDPDRFILRNVNLEFPLRELSVITGKTGSGKSLLLAALLGEVDKISGTIHMPQVVPPGERFDSKAKKNDWIIDSAVAFVAQIPWIENATIKDNILFGLPLDESRYKQVLKVCALEKDMEMLDDGDMTDIGANGINLSGGQRWRVTFARALYSRAGILVLDDIFSAVDAHVGRQLFEEALTGKLGQGRTRILVTHHIGLCISKTKYTVKLADGRVVYAGNVDDLRHSGDLQEILKDDVVVEADEETIEEIEEAEDHVDTDGAPLKMILSRRLSRRRSSYLAKVDESTGAATKKPAPKKFTEVEGREVGRIKTHVYSTYIKTSGGWKIWLPLFAVFIVNMILPVARSYWITLWTRSYSTEARNMSYVLSNIHYDSHPRILLQQNQPAEYNVQKVQDSPPNLWYYLGVYLALSVCSVAVGTLKYFVTYVASIYASRKMFERMMFVILRAPLRWLDTTPVGRISNRFSSDFNQLDSRISGVLAFTLYRVLETVGITVTAVFVTPLMILVALVLFCVVLVVALYYLSGAREIKRLESTSKSPIFEQFGSVLAGVGTIRAFDKVDDYKNRMYGKIDTFARAHWHNWVFNRWMGFQLNIIGAIFALVISGVIVSLKDIDASLAGFALSFALGYTSAIIASIRGYANLEMVMNATERIIEYTTLPTEDLGGKEPPAAWPTKGRLEVDNLVAGYAPDLPPVLKGLTFAVEPQQRVGVVGRTGAGKSSLTLALFRFIHVREGEVHIDGINTNTMTLHDLRSRLAIIPQDPVLFSGTIRSNLDPFDEHTDAELRDALERVHLVSDTSAPSRDPTLVASSDNGGAGSGSVSPNPANETNTNVFRSLSSKISEGGLNLSQGQRQLLCLARAIVSQRRILVLDEATSAVDMATDVLIQRSIREEFGDSTLLVIAHRLSTIADFDKILVMGEGRVLEYDSPKVLWEKKGVFYDMCNSSGEKEELEKIIIRGE